MLGSAFRPDLLRQLQRRRGWWQLREGVTEEVFLPLTARGVGCSSPRGLDDSICKKALLARRLSNVNTSAKNSMTTPHAHTSPGFNCDRFTASSSIETSSLPPTPVKPLRDTLTLYRQRFQSPPLVDGNSNVIVTSEP